MLAILLAFVALLLAGLSFVITKKVEVLAVAIACLAIIHLLGAI